MSVYEEPDTFIPEDEEALSRLHEELRFRGYAERTQETYVIHVRRFLSTLYFDGEESAEGIRRHFLHCRDDLDYSPIYANQAISALRFFYRYVRPDTVSVARFPTVRRARRLPIVLSRMEVASVLANVSKPRYRAMLMFTYASGLRVSESVKVRPRDIDEDKKSLRIPYGKRGTDRFTLLSPVALNEVREHWPSTPMNTWVFPGGTKRGHISSRTVQRAFRRARKKAGIRKKVGPHVLRHSFATHLLELGTPLLYLQKFLGHRSPKSTLTYIHVTQKELARIRSPLDELVEGRSAEGPDDGERHELKLEPDQEARTNGRFALASESPRIYANGRPS